MKQQGSWERWQWGWMQVLGLWLCLGVCLLTPQVMQAATITVTSNADIVAVDGVVTLREAINSANANANINADVVAVGAYSNDTINFNIGGGGTVQSIALTSGFGITDPLTIDGRTQFPASPTPPIELNGAGAGGTSAFFLNAPNGQNCTIRGLVINRFQGVGIAINTNGNTIQGNFIGTNVSGTAAQGNTGSGITISANANNNLIGGTNAGEGNLISGNSAGSAVAGINIFSSSNLIEGNRIGTNAVGTGALANGQGIILQGTATGNVIGGTTPGAGNLISGNNVTGIDFFGANVTNNVVQGNKIGTDINGTAALGNAFGGGGVAGVDIQAGASNNLVGGTTAAARNIISANNQRGVFLSAGSGNVVQGNFIGTDITGTVSLGNVNFGVGVQLTTGTTNNVIGGTVAGARNLISGNIINGVQLDNAADGNFVQGNFIGTDVAGTAALGNGLAVPGACGVSIQNSSNNIVGGTVAGARNIISGNRNGIGLSGNTPITNDLVQGNYIGTDVTGKGDVGNVGSGVVYSGTATNMTLGGTVAGAGNVISGNNSIGVHIVTDNITVQGNYIGTDASGLAAITNPDAVFVEAGNNAVIGGAVAGAGNVIGGSVIANANNGIGVYLNAGTGHLVQGNYIGIGSDGGTAVPNNYGIYVHGLSGVNIGSTTAGRRNIISGNTHDGVLLDGGATGNFIQGNYIGTDVNGTTAVGNGLNIPGDGGIIVSDAPGNTIGGTTAAARNLISGNRNGIGIGGTSTNTIVQGNRIGTDVFGTNNLGNTGSGIFLSGTSVTTVGGTVAGAGNIISGSGALGIDVLSNGNTIVGNKIGTDLNGTTSIPNAQGIAVRSANNTQIGGATLAARNIISGNASGGTSAGIQILSTAPGNGTGTIIQGNYIGVAVNGTSPLGNDIGIDVTAGVTNTTIGGIMAGARNIISGNVGTSDPFTNGMGIAIEGAGANNNTVQGNFIGTDLTGTSAVPNAVGIFVRNGATGNTVGGNSPPPANYINVAGQGNLISGNSVVGLTFDSPNNTAKGNFIGTTISANSALPNVFEGIQLLGNATNNSIGGVAANEGNHISGNGRAGILVAGPQNTVISNYIGVNAGGTGALANGAQGVFISNAPNNIIGGTAAGQPNIISGNGDDGITIIGATSTGNQVLGNFIGSNASGTAGIGNAGSGVHIFSGANNNTIGGSGNGATNFIVDNKQSGIRLSGANSNIIQGNHIGLINIALGNAVSGIVLANTSNNNLIGGTVAGAGNIITASGSNGVVVSSGTGNTIEGNSIFSNGDASSLTALGIDLGTAGVTLNDAGDGDTGANNLQNFPNINTVSSGNVISGTLNSTINTQFRIEFFANTVLDASGHGEGQTFLGFQTVTTNGSGNAPISFNFTPVSGEPYITATATNLTTNDTSEFSGIAQNNPPVNTVPGAQTTNEDTNLVFSTGNANAISVADPDAGTNPIQVTLTVTNGTLTLGGTNGLPFTTGSNGSSSMAFTGTIANINIALQGLTYAPTSNFNGASTLTITSNDLGNTGPGGAQTDTDTVAITVNAVNDAPVNNVPSSTQTTNEDTNLVFSTANGNAITISDIDAGAGTMQVTLTATNGTLTLGSTAGLGSVTGNGTANIVVMGTIANINNALSGLRYSPALNYNGPATLTMLTNDGGNTGSGGALSDTDVVNINVLPVNDAPVAVNDSYTTAEDTPLTVNAASGVLANDTDVENDSLTVGALVSNPKHGTLVLNADGSFTYTPAANYNGSDSFTYRANDGTANSNLATVTLTVTPVNDAPVATNDSYSTTEDTPLTVTAVNGVLANDTDVDGDPLTAAVVVTSGNGTLTLNTNGAFTYNPAANFTGTDTFTYRANDGTANSNTATVTITINGVNDAPVNTVPGAQTTNEDTNLVLSAATTNALSVADVDAGGNAERVTLKVAHGTLTLADTTGLAFSTGDGNGDAVEVFTGKLVDLNNALDGLTYTPNADYNGPDTLTITTNDLGNTGTGGLLTDTDTVAITVNAVNDAPVNSVPGAQSISQDTALTFSSVKSNALSIADVDAGSSPVQVTLTATNGTVALASTNGLTITGGSNGGASVTFTGTVANINAALNNLTFTPIAGFSGTAGLSITTNDLGNTGSGGAKSATNAVAITVTPLARNLTINNVTLLEGNSGTTNATFTVTLSAASTVPVSVQYATADGTATAGSDYTATSGALTFAPGTTSKTITVPVLGDTTLEDNETFFVLLSNATGGVTIADNSGTATILNDDGPPSLAINDVSLLEGNSGTTNAAFTVVLTAATGKPVTVDYATVDGTATAGKDYTSTSGSLTFAPGQTSKTINVPIIGNTIVEPNKTFLVKLSNAAGAPILRGQGNGTILNDDSIQPAPTVSVRFTNVGNGDVYRTLPAVAGSVSGAPNLTVGVSVQRQSDGKFFDGSSWTASQTFLPATVSNNNFVVATGVLPQNGPNGQFLRDDRYNLTALAADNAGHSGSANITLIIDHTPPIVSITIPKNLVPPATLLAIGGKIVDAPGGTGVQRVVLSIIRVRDGKSFNGTTFATSPVVNGKAQPFTLTTSLDDAKGVWARRTGLPFGSDLQVGDYRLLAVAIDGAGNRAQATAMFTVSSNPTATTPTASSVALSTAKVSVATSSVQLRFLGVLDAESAGDTSHYSVTVNGKVVAVESVGYNASTHSVTLSLPDGSLHAGDKVTVQWHDVTDAQDKTVAGQTGPLAAR